MDKLNYLLEKTDILVAEVDDLSKKNKTNTSSIQTLQTNLGNAQNNIITLQTNINSINNNICNNNLLINGRFKINQRGQSSYSGNGKYTVDRWSLSGSNITINITDGIVTGTTSAAWSGIKQILEFPSTLAGKTVTASFCGTGGSSGVRLTVKRGASDLLYKDGLIGETGVITLTVTIPNDIVDSEILCVAIYNRGADTTTYNWCKLEVGEVATPFAPRVYAEELALCQRYYIGSTIQNRALRLNTPAFLATSATQVYALINLPVTMRTTPTLTINNMPSIRGSGINKTATSISIFDVIRPDGIMILITSSGLTAYNAYALYNGYIQLDAELY